MLAVRLLFYCLLRLKLALIPAFIIAIYARLSWVPHRVKSVSQGGFFAASERIVIT